MSNYQKMISDFYNSLIGYVKRLVPNFLKKKNMCSIMRT